MNLLAAESGLLRILTLSDPNTRVVLLGSSLLGLACGVLGVFAVLRRRALIGDVIAHSALPGVCGAFLLWHDRSMPVLLGGGLVAGLLGVLCVHCIRRHTRIKEDAALAIVLSGFFGVGLVLSSLVQSLPTGAAAGLDTFIFGKAASMTRADVAWTAGLAAVTLLVLVPLSKELQLLCFDRAFAAGLGRRTGVLDAVLFGMITVCTIIGLPAAGAILVASLLIIPAAAARYWTERLAVLLFLSGVFGVLATSSGALVSAAVPKLSAGPAMTIAAAIIFAVSAAFAPERGFAPAFWRRARLRRKIASQNLLRAVYELAESGDGPVVSRHALMLKRAWTDGQLHRLIERAIDARTVEATGAGVLLTPKGLDAARATVRTHRLWEAYLVAHADIAPDHVDRDADQIEHILSPEMIADLEARLAEDEPVPPSPHPVSRTGDRGVHA